MAKQNACIIKWLYFKSTDHLLCLTIMRAVEGRKKVKYLRYCRFLNPELSEMYIPSCCGLLSSKCPFLYHFIFAPTIGLALKLHVKVTTSPSMAWMISVVSLGFKISGLNLTLIVVVCFRWTPFLSSRALFDAKHDKLVNSLWALKVRRLRVWNVKPLSSLVTSSWMSSCKKL